MNKPQKHTNENSLYLDRNSNYTSIYKSKLTKSYNSCPCITLYINFSSIKIK